MVSAFIKGNDFKEQKKKKEEKKATGRTSKLKDLPKALPAGPPSLFGLHPSREQTAWL